MTSKQRVENALKKAPIDRVPVHFEATPEVNHQLLDSMHLETMEQLRHALGDDLRYIEPDYIGTPLGSFEDGSVEGYWGERYKYKAYEGGAYLEPVLLPFENINDLKDLDEEQFPTSKIFHYDNIKEKCVSYNNEFALCIGSAGDMDFINSIGRARGMERVLMDLVLDDPVFLKIMDARFEFYFNTHEKLLQAADGQIMIAHIGEDLGNQIGQMISMETFNKHFAPKLQKYFSMVHSYGAWSMMHMCGTVVNFLPKLIELGLDIQDVVQPTTPEMDIAYLSKNFGDKLNWCGSLCVQTTLPNGSKDDVRKETMRRTKIFRNGGLILGPTHAIQVGTPIENILEMYRAAGSLATESELIKIRKAVYGEKMEADTINMSKLF